MGRALWLVANLGPCFSRTTASVASWQASQTHVCFSNTSLTLADCFLFGLLETYLLKSSTFLSKAPNAVFLRPTPSHFKFSAKGARSAMLSQRGNQSKSRGRGSHNTQEARAGREAGRTDLKSPPADCARASLSLSQVRMSIQCYSLATSAADVWFTRKDGWRMARASYLYMPHRPSPNHARSGSCELACKVFSSIREHQTDYVHRDLAYCFPSHCRS